MRIVGLLACFTLVNLVLADWNQPYKIYENNQDINNYGMYLDTSTQKVHIVFTVGNNDKVFYYYMSVSANGVPETPKLLTELSTTPTSGFPAFITGRNDGKHIFVGLTADRHNNGSVYSDVYFMESKNDGQEFSDPMAARNNDIEDRANRDTPKLIRTISNRIIICYQKDDKLVYTYRAPNSVVWNNENTLTPSKTWPRTHSIITYKNEKDDETICIGALYFDPGPKVSHLIISTTTNNALTWEHYEQLFESNMEYKNLTLAYSTTTQRLLYSPLSFSATKTVIIYERKKRETRIFAAFPINGDAINPAINLGYANSSPSIFYFIDRIDDSNESRLLAMFPENHEDRFEHLASPILGFDDHDVQIYTLYSSLYAIGLNGKRTFMGSKYTFATNTSKDSS